MHKILLLLLFLTLLTALHAQDALVLYRQGRYQESIAITLEEIRVNERNMNAYSVLGWSYLKLGRYQNAIQYGKRGLQFSPNDPRIIEIVAEAYYYQGSYAEALPYLTQYVTLMPNAQNTAFVYYLIGESLFALEKYRKAEIALSAAVQRNTSESSWWARTGEIRELIGRQEQALAAYKKSRVLGNTSTELLKSITRLELVLSE